MAIVSTDDDAKGMGKDEISLNPGFFDTSDWS